MGMSIFYMLDYLRWNQPVVGEGGGTPHMKGVGMVVGNFELNP